MEVCVEPGARNEKHTPKMTSCLFFFVHFNVLEQLFNRPFHLPNLVQMTCFVSIYCAFRYYNGALKR